MGIRHTRTTLKRDMDGHSWRCDCGAPLETRARESGKGKMAGTLAAPRAARTEGGRAGAIVLRTRQLVKHYGQRAAVKGLNLEVARGEIFGFLGPNGAGKTTTIRMCLGLIAPTSGSVEILGQDVVTHRAEILPRVGA